jgi:hypothetical protein
VPMRPRLLGLANKRPNHSGRQAVPRVRIIAWWWALLGAVAVTASAWITIAVLLSIAGHDKALRIDAIKTGLTVGAGAGGAIALFLGFRRQYLAEHAQVSSDFDAAERRVTDLYTKAVEQLGHENAAVRQGGLYALERVGENNPTYRQTIIDVICAYLRMPFTLQDPDMGDQGGDASSSELGRRAGRDPEVQVRKTAQHLLALHLRDPDDRLPVAGGRIFWEQMNINLDGAHLLDFMLLHCAMGSGSFQAATFTGDTWFDGTTFEKGAWFYQATFHGDASFAGATFAGDAQFRDVTFAGGAQFDQAIFHTEPDLKDLRAKGVVLQAPWRLEKLSSGFSRVIRDHAAAAASCGSTAENSEQGAPPAGREASGPGSIPSSAG